MINANSTAKKTFGTR